MAEEKEAFYVGIHEPSEFRKELLSSCKDAIVMLKRYEIHRERRKLKAELQAELTKKLKEINFLSVKLKGLFPEHKLREIPGFKHHPKKKEQLAVQGTPKQQSKARDKHLSEIDRLERELQNIERKMSVINE